MSTSTRVAWWNWAVFWRAWLVFWLIFVLVFLVDGINAGWVDIGTTLGGAVIAVAPWIVRWISRGRLG
jgi:hypothetical protein